MTVSVWCLFLALPLVGLKFVNVAFPGHTHFFYLEANYVVWIVRNSAL